MSLRIVCALLGAAAVASLAPPAVAADRLSVRFGVAAFGAVDPLRDVKTVAGCGYDYIEPYIQRVAKGDYSESNVVASTDEIGMLANAFNAMAKDLDASRAELAP